MEPHSKRYPESHEPESYISKTVKLHCSEESKSRQAAGWPQTASEYLSSEDPFECTMEGLLLLDAVEETLAVGALRRHVTKVLALKPSREPADVPQAGAPDNKQT
jgi:hypothetical protein